MTDTHAQGLAKAIEKYGPMLKQLWHARTGKPLSDEELRDFLDPNVDTLDMDKLYNKWREEEAEERFQKARSEHVRTR